MGYNSPAMPLSLYLHIPFCQVRCAYCDFNTYAGLEALMPAYASALAREARGCGPAAEAPVHSIFFGGGTPSLLPLPALGEVFAALRASFALTADCEITLEANPGTVDPAYLTGLRALGVNRLSLGVQSAQPHELRLLDRLHTFEQAVQSVGWARAAGFDASSCGLNLDLIYGLPGQTLADWQQTVRAALAEGHRDGVALAPEHLSLYALTLEHGAPMRAWVGRGLLPLPDPDLAADMYEWAGETLEAHGYLQYEISNWARAAGAQAADGSRYACRHNLQYWRNLPYLGLGAGAHGCAHGWRYANVRSPRAYIERMRQGGAQQFPFSSAVAEKTLLDRETEMNETMLLGFRLVQEGVRAQGFRARFGVDPGERYGRDLAELRAQGLIEWDATGARLTRRGRLLANHVFRRFL